MNERKDEIVCEALTRVDGGCRDVNWFGLGVEGVGAIFEYLANLYSSGTIRIGDDDASQAFNIDAAIAALSDQRTVGAYFARGPRELTQMQFFAFYDTAKHSWFLELTFFPQDVDLAGGLAPLLEHFEMMKKVSGASGWFIRFEDASFAISWENRDHPEVIVTSADAPELLAPS